MRSRSRGASLTLYQRNTYRHGGGAVRNPLSCTRNLDTNISTSWDDESDITPRLRHHRLGRQPQQYTIGAVCSNHNSFLTYAPFGYLDIHDCYCF